MNKPPFHQQKTIYQDCLCCGYKNGMSVTVTGDGMELLHCFAGCSQTDLLAVRRGQGQPFPSTHIIPIKAQGKDTAQKTGEAQKMWDSAQDGRTGLVPFYLAARGLVGLVPDSLRFLPSHLHKPSQSTWPVMLAAVTDIHSKLHAIHRTYLTKDGRAKAPVMPPKMTYGPVGGFACHLAPAASEMAVSEGIETGLAVQLSTGLPTWAALSAGGICNLILPPLPLASEVVIAADNDANGCGQRAAHDAARVWREQGRRVRIAMPLEIGTDFNDVLFREAAQ